MDRQNIVQLRLQRYKRAAHKTPLPHQLKMLTKAVVRAKAEGVEVPK